MVLSRREFGRGASAVAMAAPFGAPLLAQSLPTDAVQKIGAYAEAHRRFFGLPGLTLGVTVPGGAGTVLNFGYANADARTPITPDTLFQIGSISKVMTALIVHQLAAEGRLRLTDPLESVLPGHSAAARQRHHSSAADRPHLRARRQPALVRRGRPVDRVPARRALVLFEHRLRYPRQGRRARRRQAPRPAVSRSGFSPRSACAAAAARSSARTAPPTRRAMRRRTSTIPYARGVPLAPAGWVDVTFGAGNVASTAEDMNLFIRALAGMRPGPRRARPDAAAGRSNSPVMRSRPTRRRCPTATG